MEFVNWSLDPNKLWFNNGSCIITEYESDKDNRVVNFADFSNFALLDHQFYHQFHIDNFEIVPVDGYGFLLSMMLKDGRHHEAVFVPCYSYQSTCTMSPDVSILHVIAYNADSGTRTIHRVICEEVLV